MKRLFIMAAAMVIAITANAKVNERTIGLTSETVAEHTEAAFPGGESACSNWITQNLRYPTSCIEDGIEGTVLARFEVDAQGNISDIRTSSDSDYLLAQEARRVISLMPQWQPATSDGMPVPTRYLLSIRFSLSND